MSSIRPQDRVSLCRYSYADQRQCRTPRSPRHPHFCYFHARRESQSVAADQLASDLSYFFSGQYISANDLCAALGRLIPAVVRGDIKPRTASTIAYLAQTFIQAIQIAQKEYIYAFNTPKWGEVIRHNVSCNLKRINETVPEEQVERFAVANNEEEQQQDEPANQNEPQNDESSEPTPEPTEVSAEDSRSGGTSVPRSRSGGSSDPCGCSAESSDSDEDSNDESPVDEDTDQDPDEDQDEQLDSHDSAPTPEPLTPVEATLAKN